MKVMLDPPECDLYSRFLGIVDYFWENMAKKFHPGKIECFVIDTIVTSVVFKGGGDTNLTCARKSLCHRASCDGYA